jgi:hypothetical protein
LGKRFAADNFGDNPAFGTAERACFSDTDAITFLALILIVVCFESPRFHDGFAVFGMNRPIFDSDHSRFVHFVTND